MRVVGESDLWFGRTSGKSLGLHFVCVGGGGEEREQSNMINAASVLKTKSLESEISDEV